MSYNPELYIHEMDRQAFAVLNTFPVFLKLMEVYMAHFDEKKARLELMSSAIRLNEDQMPDVYNLLPPICDKLSIPVPELYYMQSKELNAAAGGNREPYIFVTSALVDQLSPEMISSALAHECGHIACRHNLYHSLAMQLVRGIDKIPLTRHPVLGRYLTPALVKALLFWDRCSEFSADRAAVLCDGNVDVTVGMLLKIHGYPDNINKDEFIRQAIDLKDYVNESKFNQILNHLITGDEDHPRIASRVCECYEWSKSEQFSEIIHGTYKPDDLEKDKAPDLNEKEILAADISIDSAGSISEEEYIKINQELNRINQELNSYTNKADFSDYALSVFSGTICGAIDSLFIGKISITGKDIGLSHEQVNRFIQEYAKKRGFEGVRLKDAISDLEKEFKVAQDNIWKGADIGVSAKNHHLADLSHHPTPLGLTSAILVQFLRVGTFVNKDGTWHLVPIKTSTSELIKIWGPAVITGILNWFIAISEHKYEDDSGQELPESLHRLAHLAASTPLILEIVKCADNWFGHLVSDMGGSKNTAGAGMGIPGLFISLLHELSGLPGLKDSGLPALVNDLYVNQKWNLRRELAYVNAAGKQFVPVALNEIMVRTCFMVSRLIKEISKGRNLQTIDWYNVVPLNNRTLDRMLTVASLTFTAADTADAAVRAAVASGGNWILFAGHFAARFNYVGAGRAAIAIVREISNEKKEAQLIHERLILMEAKTAFKVQELEVYKKKLEELLANYIAEDIEAFMTGFDYMKEGLASHDSDLFIKGNLVIQRVLGREAQFTNQEEFDELMDSDIPLVF